MAWSYHIARITLKLLLLVLTRWQVRGGKNIPGEGQLLVVSNHLHIVDPPLLAFGLGRRVRFMAKRELFQSRLSSYVLRSFGAFSVNRGQPDRKALRQAEEVLAEGQTLLMFPEGMRSHNGQLRPAFPGAALIAARSGSLILPVGITGTETLKGIGWLFNRPRITVNFGVPFRLPPLNGKISKAELGKRTEDIMQHIAELLPIQYRGNYTKGNLNDAQS